MSVIIDQFKVHKLDLPPRWNETKVRVKRNADMLNAFASENNVTELTIVEMMKVLGRPRGSIYQIRLECKRCEFDIPELKVKEEYRERATSDMKVEKKCRVETKDESIEVQLEYVEGLLVLGDGRVNPDDINEMIYVLR